MKIIKFRIWHKVFNEWWTDKIYRDVTKELTLEQDFVYQPFINLLDKNGAEIYIGDIIVFCGEKSILWEVIWNGKEFAFGFQKINDKNYIMGVNDTSGNCIEVVGNIFENPELLTNN